MDDLSISSDLPKNQQELFIELKKKIDVKQQKTAPRPVSCVYRRSLSGRELAFERQSKDKSCHLCIGN